MGFRQNLGNTFDFANSFLFFAPRSGYISMGDYNAAFISCATPPFDPCAGTPYDRQWLPVQGDIIGRARGELPWFGLLKLTLQPTITCCSAWGDPEAPKNSWDSLAVSLVVLFAFPFILERSEEHTSELQSLRHLVCRLLLEKKKKKKKIKKYIIIIRI